MIQTYTLKPTTEDTFSSAKKILKKIKNGKFASLILIELIFLLIILHLKVWIILNLF